MPRLTKERRAELHEAVRRNDTIDSELARQFGVSREAVRIVRAKLGLERVEHSTLQDLCKQHGEKQVMTDLAEMQTMYFREKYGVSAAWVADQRRKLGLTTPLTQRQQELMALVGHELGKVSDISLAQKHGLHQSVISWFRKRLGIAPFRKRLARIDPAFVRECVEKGMTDAQIGEQLGTSGPSVAFHRKRNGILRRAAK